VRGQNFCHSPFAIRHSPSIVANQLHIGFPSPRTPAAERESEVRVFSIKARRHEESEARQEGACPWEKLVKPP
jgi:hypothetical protein